MVNFYILTAIFILLCLNVFDSHLWEGRRRMMARRGLYGFCLFLFSLSVVFSCGKVRREEWRGANATRRMTWY